MDDLGRLIKNLRKAAGLSQTQLAQRHGMSRATISGIENTRQSDRLNLGVGGVAAGTLGRSEENPRDSVFSYNGTVTEKDAVSLTMPVRLESYGWGY